jgi:hypothetical protein
VSAQVECDSISWKRHIEQLLTLPARLYRPRSVGTRVGHDPAVLDRFHDLPQIVEVDERVAVDQYHVCEPARLERADLICFGGQLVSVP